MICLFFETVDSSPAQVDDSLTVVQGSFETGHEEYVVAIDFAERTVVHLFEKQLVLVLYSDPAFERIPETHQPNTPERFVTCCRAFPGVQRSCCRVLSCCECFEKLARAFDGPQSALERRFVMGVAVKK